MIVEQGLAPGTSIYQSTPELKDKFKLAGENLVPIIRERNKARQVANEVFRKEL